MNEKKLLSDREVAQLLGSPLVTVQRWVYQGKIPCKLKKNNHVFKRSEIMEWAASHDFLLGQNPNEPVTPDAVAVDEFSLQQAVSRGGVLMDLEGHDIYSVLDHAVKCIGFPDGTDREAVFNELINREEIASTGMGKGVAIPHPRGTLNLDWPHPVVPVAFLKEPVDFNAVDGKPVSVLFLMFSPSTRIHLKLLSRLSICLRNHEFMTLLKKSPDKEQLLAGILAAEKAMN